MLVLGRGFWVGDFRGRDFTVKDVKRLYQSVSKHIDRDWEFYILTNDMLAKTPGTKIPLLHGDKWPGWWSKVELHRPDLPEGRTLYLDLDSHVIRSLQPILDFEGDLVMFPSCSKGRKRKDAGWVHRYQAATMLFTPGKMVDIYDRFKEDDENLMQIYRSEQDIMGDWIPNQPTFPSEWLMKLGKLEGRKELWKTPPDDVIIVTGQTKRGLFRNLHKISWFEKMARG
jgi:hypothetical protein